MERKPSDQDHSKEEHWKEEHSEKCEEKIITTNRPFIPEIIIPRLENREPWTISGIVMFIDIAGYTALTEQHSEDKGCESIRNAICDFFGKIITIIEKYNGHVLKFAGDAMYVLFPELVGLPYYLATHCALEISNVSVQEPQKLSVKVGLSAGSVHCAILEGEKGRREFLPIGEPIIGSGHCEQNTTVETRRVVVDETVWTHITSEFDGEQIEKPKPEGTEKKFYHIKSANNPPPQVLELSKTHNQTPLKSLNGFTPADTQEQINRELFPDDFAEIREISVVFIDISGIDPTSSDSFPTIQKIFQIIDIGLNTYGGLLRQFILDDKGTVAIGIFRKVHHSVDACRAALMITALGWKVSIGITSGVCFCGPIGSCDRREWGSVGDKMNLAARLMCMAKGEKVLMNCQTKLFESHVLIDEPRILIDKDVKTALDSKQITHISTDLGEKQFKGKDKLIRVYQLFNCDPDHLKILSMTDKEEIFHKFDSMSFESQLFLKMAAVHETREPSDPRFCIFELVTSGLSYDTVSFTDYQKRIAVILNLLDKGYIKRVNEVKITDFVVGWFRFCEPSLATLILEWNPEGVMKRWNDNFLREAIPQLETNQYLFREFKNIAKSIPDPRLSDNTLAALDLVQNRLVPSEAFFQCSIEIQQFALCYQALLENPDMDVPSPIPIRNQSD